MIIKFESFTRLLMVTCLSKLLPLYTVTEYPKSGGTWVSQMLSDYLNIPFPRNQFPKLQPSIIHGHYLYFPTMRNVFVVLRDGRDIMISFYYFSLFNNTRLVEITRRELRFDDYDDIKNNLPEFIEYKFTRKRHPMFSRFFTWTEFVNSWIDKDMPFIRYENLLQDPVKELGKAIYKVCKVKPDESLLRQIAEKYSFKNLSKRNPGQENKHSFLRKGIAGDWKNHFSREARQVFHKFAGRELIKLGYEVDDSWVK